MPGLESSFVILLPFEQICTIGNASQSQVCPIGELCFQDPTRAGRYVDAQARTGSRAQ